jgi:hypothetical protein
MTEYEEHLEIVSDSDGEDYSISEQEDIHCNCCDEILDYFENEFYDWENDTYYCQNCWNDYVKD